MPAALANTLGIAIGKRTYKAYCDLIASPRYRRAMNEGARPQRLLLASTGTKDPKASDILYVKALAAPFTVNTMPEGTLKAFADHGEVGGRCPPTAATARRCSRRIAKAGDRPRCAGGAAAGGRRRVVREVVERADGGDRVQERSAQKAG